VILQVLPEPIDELLRVLGYWDHILVGLTKTLWIYVWGLAIGFFLGLSISILRQYGGRFISVISTGYVEFVRGTPIMAQMFLLYYLPYSLNIPIERWSFYVSNELFGRDLTFVLLDHQTLIGILTLGLNSAAYQAEYFRGAIVSIEAGQLEAAQSLGMSRRSGIIHVVLPQALRRVIPAWSNEAAYLPKYTVIVFYIGVTELFSKAHYIVTELFLTLTTYLLVAAIFIVLITIISKGLDIVYNKTKIPGL
jgi:polar amino acid transport system permease protein